MVMTTSVTTMHTNHTPDASGARLTAVEFEAAGHAINQVNATTKRLEAWQQAIVTDILTGDCPFGILEHIQKHAGPDLLKHVLETPGDDDPHELANARVWSASMHNLLDVFDIIYLGNRPMTLQEQLDRLADQYRRNPATRTPEPATQNEHHMNYFQPFGDGDFLIRCSCGAHWKLARSATPAQLEESKRSHRISVGLEPSVTL